jgi:hypothetical protein
MLFPQGSDDIFDLLCKKYDRENILLTNKNNAVILTSLFSNCTNKFYWR